jgi:hypothetical protein
MFFLSYYRIEIFETHATHRPLVEQFCQGLNFTVCKLKTHLAFVLYSAVFGLRLCNSDAPFFYLLGLT